MRGWRSRWGRRASAAYVLLLSAALGYATYHALFNRSRFMFPGTLLVSLGLPWTRTMTGTLDSTSGGALWPTLFVSFAINAGMLYFIGSRFEQLARGPRP
jgi:hypothetical protein